MILFNCLFIIDLPDSGPTISRLHVEHDTEAEVRLHCATYRARPRAELSWYINDIAADQLREFGVAVDGGWPISSARIRRPPPGFNHVLNHPLSEEMELFNSSSYLRLDARKLSAKLTKLRNALQLQSDPSNRLDTERSMLDTLSDQFKQNLLFGAQEMDELRITCKADIRHVIEQSSTLKIVESSSQDPPKYSTG